MSALNGPINCAGIPGQPSQVTWLGKLIFFRLGFGLEVWNESSDQGFG